MIIVQTIVDSGWRTSSQVLLPRAGARSSTIMHICFNWHPLCFSWSWDQAIVLYQGKSYFGQLDIVVTIQLPIADGFGFKSLSKSTLPSKIPTHYCSLSVSNPDGGSTTVQPLWPESPNQHGYGIFCGVVKKKKMACPNCAPTVLILCYIICVTVEINRLQ